MKLILDTIQLAFMGVTIYFLIKNWGKTTYCDKIVQFSSYVVVLELGMVFFNDFNIFTFIIWLAISGINFMVVNQHLSLQHKRILPEYGKTLYNNTVGLVRK